MGWGYPPVLTWDEGTLVRKDGVPPPSGRMGVHPLCQEGWEYPQSARWGGPPSKCARQTPVKTVPSPFLWNAGSKNCSGNKTFLLCECKMHTAHCIASTRSAVLSGKRGTSVLSGEGIHQSCADQGVPLVIFASLTCASRYLRFSKDKG